MKNFEIRFVDGHDLRYKVVKVVAENENLAMQKFWDIYDSAFEHRIVGIEQKK